SPFTLNWTLYNSSTPSNNHISYIFVEFYLFVNGVIYNGTSRTNSTGVMQLSLFYSGNYSIQIFAINNASSNLTSQNLSTGNQQKIPMFERKSATLSLNLVNEFAIKHPLSPQNISVFPTPLNITNSILPIHPFSITVNKTNGTEYNYSLPQGNFYFEYNNRSYSPASFSYFNNISLPINHKNIKIAGYGLVFNTSTQLPYDFSLNFSSPNSVIYNNNINAESIGAGSRTINVSIPDISLHYVIDTNVTRQSSTPLKYWNQSQTSPVQYVWYNLSSTEVKDLKTAESYSSATSLMYFNTSTLNSIGSSGYLYKIEFLNGSGAFNLSAGTTFWFKEMNALYTLNAPANSSTFDPLAYNGKQLMISVATAFTKANYNAIPLSLNLWLYQAQSNEKSGSE
ncbi:MAG: hypothetical protein ACYDDC_06020, partial [Thermoplasmataceae archaeon]